MSPLFLITGCPGAGKTTLAHAVLQRYPLGVRISVDDLRDQVVSGIEHPRPGWTDEIQHQFDTARESAAAMAAIYLKRGFAVAIDDLLPYAAAELMLSRTEHPTPVRIALIPSVETAIERNRTRTNKIMNDAMREDLGKWIPGLHGDLSQQYGDKSAWLKLDSDRPIEELSQAAWAAT